MHRNICLLIAGLNFTLKAVCTVCIHIALSSMDFLHLYKALQRLAQEVGCGAWQVEWTTLSSSSLLVAIEYQSIKDNRGFRYLLFRYRYNAGIFDTDMILILFNFKISILILTFCQLQNFDTNTETNTSIKWSILRPKFA